MLFDAAAATATSIAAVGIAADSAITAVALNAEDIHYIDAFLVVHWDQKMFCISGSPLAEISAQSIVQWTSYCLISLCLVYAGVDLLLVLSLFMPILGDVCWRARH